MLIGLEMPFEGLRFIFRLALAGRDLPGHGFERRRIAQFGGPPGPLLAVFVFLPLVITLRSVDKGPLGMGETSFGQGQLAPMSLHAEVLGEHHASQGEGQRTGMHPGGLHIRPEGRIVIPIDAQTIFVSQTQFEQGLRVVTLRSPFEPTESFVEVVIHLPTLGIMAADFYLRLGVPGHRLFEDFLRDGHRPRLCPNDACWQGVRGLLRTRRRPP